MQSETLIYKFKAANLGEKILLVKYRIFKTHKLENASKVFVCESRIPRSFLVLDLFCIEI